MNAVVAEAPTPDAIANRAYNRMLKPSRARLAFDGARKAANRGEYLSSLDAELRAETVAYAQRRLELKEVYGDAAADMHAREERLEWLRADEPNVKAVEKIAWVKRYYGRDGSTMADFIDDWGYTNDPRLISEGKNPVVAFRLFPKQREMIIWMIGCWLDNKPGVVVKSRDVGASWVAMALLCTLCIFRNSFMAGVGSAIEINIDRSGDPDTLFYKIRSFLEHLPPEFNAGYDVDRSSADKRVSFPLTGSSITGRAGDQAGRGGRTAIYVVDESAHFEHPKIVDKNLSANTRCRIDMSSVNGMANSFYTRAHNPAIRRFDFTWRSDPRKNDEWYKQQCAELDAVVVAQEIDCDFRASLEGVCIPRAWIDAAIDIDKFLGMDFSSGAHRGALDVADRGNDLNAYAAAKGRRIYFVDQWSGKGSDTGYSVQKAMKITAELGMTSFDYDADGLGGAAVHSDARLINEARTDAQAKLKNPKPDEYFAAGGIGVHPYRGSEAVVHPEKIVPGTKRKAVDLFANRKAQTWYEGRLGFYNAWRARRGEKYDPSRVICLAGDMPLLDLLCGQLSQATVKETITGKIQIDKNPDDVSSPDLADAALMTICPRKGGLPAIGKWIAAQGGQV